MWWKGTCTTLAWTVFQWTGISLDRFCWMFGCSCYGRCSACCLLSAVIYFYSYTRFVWRFYILWLMFTVQTWFEWSLYSSLIGLKYDLSWFLDKPDSANLWSVVTSAFFKALSHRSLCFSFIYYCLYNRNAVNYNTCHLCVSAGYVQPHGLQRRHYVFIMSRCLSRANTDSSAGLASPLRTYYCEGIRWLWAVFSFLVFSGRKLVGLLLCTHRQRRRCTTVI